MEQKKFVFKQRSVEDVKKIASGSKSDRVIKEGYKEFKSQEGENQLRVMPNTWDEKPKHYGMTIYVHYQVGPDKAQYLCLEKMRLGTSKCSICDEGYKPARAEWEAEPESNKERKEELKKYMNSLAPKKAVPMWVIDRKHEDAGPQIYLMTDAMNKEFAARGVDAFDGSLISIEDPYEGYDISFTKTGKGLGTKYIGHDVARRKTPLSTEHGEKWLEFIVSHPLPQCLVESTSEYIDAVYHAKLPNKVDADEGTDSVESKSEQVDPADVQSEEVNDAPADALHEETPAEAPAEETYSYEDLASLTTDELVDFVKSVNLLNVLDIKRAVAANNLLSKACEKMGIATPAGKPLPVKSAFAEQMDRIKASTAKADAKV